MKRALLAGAALSALAAATSAWGQAQTVGGLASSSVCPTTNSVNTGYGAPFFENRAGALCVYIEGGGNFTGNVTVGNITTLPGAVTVSGGTADKITTGNVAVTVITGPINGCYITNPTSAADEGISAAENVYINPVGNATLAGNGTNSLIVPGQTYSCIPGEAGNVTANAATANHTLTVVQW